MKNPRTVLTISTLVGMTLCGIISTRITSAQGPGGDPPTGQTPTGPGQGGPGGGPGGPGGSGGPGGFGPGRRFGGQSPYTMGTITGGDSNAGTITIQPQFGGNAQTIQVTNATQMVTQATVAVTDLKVNDQVEVEGIPTSITASSIRAGEMPSFLPGGGGRFGGGRFGKPFPGGQGGPGGPGAPGAAPNQGGQGANVQANASAAGKVTATGPLTISLGNEMSLTVKANSGAKITKIMPVTMNDLKVGDRVIASGQTNADGTFAATGLGVNIDTRSGFGGPGGPGGFGRRGPRASGE